MNEPMSFESDADWNDFITGLAEGQPQAYEKFWQRYGKRLGAVAKKIFPAGLQRRLAPDDIVQSTCRSFFIRIVDGRLAVPDAESLWSLLCSIMLNKTRMKQRYHLAKCRALNRERDLEKKDEMDSAPSFESSSEEQSPEESAMYAEMLEIVINMLDPIEQQILQLTLEDHTNEEISTKVHRSERTIRRVLQRLKEKLKAILKGEEEEN